MQGFFRSFATLMLKPGVLARRFVDGKRLKYLHPAQFYLFISVLFFFIFSFTIREAETEVSQVLKKGFEQEANLDAVEDQADSLAFVEANKLLKKNKKYIGLSEEELEALDSLMTEEPELVNFSFGIKRDTLDSLIAVGAPVDQKIKAMGIKKDANSFEKKLYIQLLKLYEKKGGGMLQVLFDTIPIAMFLLLPLFALFLKIFYWKPATFAHHLVFSFYYFTFIFASYCIILLVNKVWEIPVGLKVLISFSFVFYLMLALRNFYKSSTKSALFKASAMSMLYLLIVVPLAAAGILLSSFMLY